MTAAVGVNVVAVGDASVPPIVGVVVGSAVDDGARFTPRRLVSEEVSATVGSVDDAADDDVAGMGEIFFVSPVVMVVVDNEGVGTINAGTVGASIQRTRNSSLPPNCEL
jgi:hypothetical protein